MAGAAGTGRGARALPGAGRLPPLLVCSPTRGGAGLAPAHSRSLQLAAAGTGQGCAPREGARCWRARRGAPGLRLLAAGGPMRQVREGREIQSSGDAQRGQRAVQQRPEPGGGRQEAAAART